MSDENTALAVVEPRPSRSEQIGEIAAALAAAQGQIEAARKDSTNPFFRSKYADLASCWDACRDPLSANKLAVVQLPSVHHESLAEPLEVKRDHDKPPKLIHRWQYVTVETMLMHASGQFLSSSLTMVCSDDTPQGAGSAISYARRYSLCSMVGIAPGDDDDGSGASSPVHRRAAAAVRPDWIDTMRDRLNAAKTPKECDTISGEIRKLYDQLKPEQLTAFGAEIKSLATVRDERKAALAPPPTTGAGREALDKIAGQLLKEHGNAVIAMIEALKLPPLDSCSLDELAKIREGMGVKS